MIPLRDREMTLLLADRAYFGKFYEQHRRFLLYAASRFTSDRGQMEDLVHDAALRLMQCIPTLRTLGEAKTASYLYTTVKSVYIDHRRRMSSTEVPMSAETLEQLGDSAEPMDYAAKWDIHILRQKLTPREWYLLEARYITGSGDEEIAATLGCAPDSIRNLVSRARRRAKSVLADRE